MATPRALSFEAFVDGLAAAGAPPLERAALRALYRHHQELVRWAPTIDLVGPAVADELFDRHYAESLAALDWLPEGAMRLLDLGSGAGFPGLILAAARPDATVWLVESRARKAAFLAAAARKMEIEVEVVNGRIGTRPPSSPTQLPRNLSVLTMRALRLAPEAIRTLLPHLAEHGRMLIWGGSEAHELPGELVLEREALLGKSRRRYLRQYRPAGGSGSSERTGGRR